MKYASEIDSGAMVYSYISRFIIRFEVFIMIVSGLRKFTGG
jgi:hypothetical protein